MKSQSHTHFKNWHKPCVVCSMLVSVGEKAAGVMAYMFDICRCGGLSKTAWAAKHIAYNEDTYKVVMIINELQKFL